MQNGMIDIIKKIALLSTGGTIASRPMKDGLMPALCAKEIAGFVRADEIEIVPHDVFFLDSSNIQPEEWSVLAKACDEAMKDCDGVVVTHGTDTMGYTAAALSFMLLGQKKPVVITGSQLPLGVPLSDAEGNLMCAFRVACQNIGGTYVCFDRKIIAGTRAVKTRTTSFDAFDSINRPLAGTIDSDGIHMTKPVWCDIPYKLRTAMDDSVFLLKLFPGTQVGVLDYVAQAGYRGLVIEAFGLGGLHYIRRNLVGKLRELREKGICVLILTQCMYESANLGIYEVGSQLQKSDVISGCDMTTEAAVTKMMWALAQENTEELLSKNLCGEISK